jgi:nicotinate-nucleotide pyrophosphorylase (carboxylating)
MTLFDPPITAVREVVARALAEDLGALGDITASLVPTGATVRADICSRGTGVLAGTLCATEACWQVDDDMDVTWNMGDGAALEPGTIVGVLEGSLASVLTAERTALNFLCHLSGVGHPQNAARTSSRRESGRAGWWWREPSGLAE